MGDSSFCFLPFQRSIVLIWTVSRSLYTFNYCKSQRFCLCRLYWPIFTIKTKKLKYCLLIHLKTMINSYVIKNILKIKKFTRGVALFHIFVHFFHIWLHKKQLDSPICLCIQSVILYVMKTLEKFTVHSREWKWKRQILSLYYYQNSFNLKGLPWKGTWPNFKNQ